MKKPSTSPIPTLISKVTTTPANVVCSKWKPGVWALKNAASMVDEHDGSARRMGLRSLGLEKVERTWRIIPVTKYHGGPHISVIFTVGLISSIFLGGNPRFLHFSISIWLLLGGPRVSSSDRPPVYWRHKVRPWMGPGSKNTTNLQVLGTSGPKPWWSPSPRDPITEPCVSEVNVSLYTPCSSSFDKGDWICREGKSCGNLHGIHPSSTRTPTCSPDVLG